MNPYLVHVERASIHDWVVSVRDLLTDREVSRRVYNGNVVKIDERLDTYGKLSDMESWYCNTEQEARELAAAMAAEIPGRKVLIFKLEGVATAPPSKATFANYSAKGLVPE